MKGKRQLAFLLSFLMTFSFSLRAEDQKAPAADETQKTETAQPAEASQPAEQPPAEQPPAEQPPAPPEHPNKITAIEIRGNQIVSTNTVLSKLQSHAGEPLVQATINEDVKRLYQAGFFQDIRMEVEEVSEGYKLIVNVIEKWMSPALVV